MQTEVFSADFSAAADIIKNGGLVAVPTETVYGLAGSGLNESAVLKIYAVKGRPEVKPLSLMVHDASWMERLCDNIPAQAKLLADRFWPGPLTIVLQSKEYVPGIVRAGGATLGLRCPDHKATLELLRLADLPLAAPSANPSGAPSPKSAAEVLGYFDGRIDAVIDGGECALGVESTIIDMSRTPFRILRQGALPEQELGDALAQSLRVIGITGGTGCGKTTALDILETHGALVIDCDRVYHELLESGGALVSEIRERFPGCVTDGKVDRKALGALVFANAAELEKLNEISHEHIRREVQRRLRTWAMQGGALAAIDAIELISSGLSERCETTVAVLSDEEHRLRRIMHRDSIALEYARMRLKAQKDSAYFEQNCDHVIYNNGSLEQFEQSCEKLFGEILENGKK